MSAYPGSFPAFAAADSVGLLARRHCAARPSRPNVQGSGSRGITPPYSRASATGLHRLPGTESAVDVAENFGIPVWPGRCNPPGEQSRGAQNNGAPRKNLWALRCVLVAPRAQVHAWPARGAQLDIERRFEDLLEQLPLINGGRRPHT